MFRLGGKIAILLGIVFIVSLACNFPGVRDPQIEEIAENDSPSSIPVVENKPTDVADVSTTEPNPVEEQAQMEVGGPNNPGVMGVDYAFDLWDIKVVDYLRGLPALSRIREDRPELPDPPAGWEYAIVKVFVRCKIIDEYSHSLSMYEIFMIGDQGVSYTDRLMDVPVRELVYSDFYTGEADEAWVDALVPVEETGMMFVFTLQGYEENPGVTHFIALEADAGYLTPPLDLQGEALTGNSPDSAVAFGNAAVVQGWEIRILETFRGQNAFEQLQIAAEIGKVFNFRDVPQPESGMEYLVYRANVRYVGEPRENGLACFHQSDFKLVYADGTEDENQLLFMPPFPSVDGCYLPGGVRTGYGRGVVPIGDQKVVLAFPEMGERVFFKTEKNP